MSSTIKKISFFLTLIFVINIGVLSVFSQTLSIQGEKIDCIMPSSEGAALIKAVERQPSLATGVPDISIPIYSIPNSPVNLKLTYNASGLLVDELPTIAGLGWRMESGGMITRVVLGYPDDYPVKGYLNQSTSTKSFNSKVLTNYVDSDFEYLINNITPAYFDDSPDIFYYDVLGTKGKFVLGYNGEVFCYPKTNMKFTYTKATDGQITSFNVALGNGNEVVFNNKEQCLLTNYSNITSTFNSSWYISEVKSNNQILIGYSYKEDVLTDTQIQSYYENRKAYEKEVINNGTSTTSTVSYTARFYAPLITYIRTNRTIVYFEYGYKVVDFANTPQGSQGSWHYLSGIRINFDVNHVYTTSPVFYKYFFEYNGFPETTSAVQSRSGFLLSSFKVDVPNVILPYSFEYYQGTLPSLGTTRRDLWGYYNNNGNSNSLIPSIYSTNGILTPLNVYGSTTSLTRTDRSSSLSQSMVGNLKSYTTPEGLNTEYIYNLNSFLFNNIEVQGGGLRVEAIKHYDENSVLLDQVNFSYLADGGSITSGYLLFHSLPVLGMKTSSYPLETGTFSSKDLYIKSAYTGMGIAPYSNPVIYSKVKVSKTGNGYSNYYFDVPVNRNNTSIIPTELSWSTSSTNKRTFFYSSDDPIIDGTLYFGNDSYTTTPSLFNQWLTPLLVKQCDYSESNIKVRELQLNYGSLEVSRLASGSKIMAVFNYVNIIPPTHYEPSYTSIISLYHLSKIYFLSAWRELVSSTETIYTPNGSQSTSTSSSFTYTRPLDGLDFSYIKQKQTTNAQGEIITSKTKYCFDTSLSFPDAPSLQERHNQLVECLKQFNTPEEEGYSLPTILRLPNTDEQTCYNIFNSNIPNVSPELKAIALLKAQMNYSMPIEEYTILNRLGKQTVIDATFNMFTEEANKSVYPKSTYKLKKLVDSNSFIDLRAFDNSGSYQLTFDPAYKKVSEITLFGEKGEVLESLGENNVYKSQVWDNYGDYVKLEGVNCRYTALSVSAAVETIRSSNPNAFITEFKYLFPLGLISQHDPRGRKSYLIYNKLGEKIAQKDHDKNLRKLSINRRILQQGQPAVVLESDPDADPDLLVEKITTNFDVNVGGSTDIAHPVVCSNFYYSPYYTYTVNWGDGSPIQTVTNSTFSHKYSTIGTKTLTFTCSRFGTIIQNGTIVKTVTLQKVNPFTVVYSYQDIAESVNGNYYNSVSFISGNSYNNLLISAFLSGGIGEYNTQWVISFTPERGGAPVTDTLTYTIRGTGNYASHSFNDFGRYDVTFTVTDATGTSDQTTYSNSWTFFKRSEVRVP